MQLFFGLVLLLLVSVALAFPGGETDDTSDKGKGDEGDKGGKRKGSDAADKGTEDTDGGKVGKAKGADAADKGTDDTKGGKDNGPDKVVSDTAATVVETVQVPGTR